jgi:hypothetical protein
MGTVDDTKFFLTAADEITGLDDAFREWDESAPALVLAEGSGPNRTDGRAEQPVKKKSGFAPESLEEAIRALIGDEAPPAPPRRRLAKGTGRFGIPRL